MSIRAVILDADGPLYYRTNEISAQNQALLEKYGFKGTLKDLNNAYKTAEALAGTSLPRKRGQNFSTFTRKLSSQKSSR
jgi:hypothetical protein